MRLVEHPNVVDLKAFFYSNGDKVRKRIGPFTQSVPMLIVHCQFL
jgi:hypothetical protein